MLDRINQAALFVADPLLNWLLYLPTDLALVIVAIGTGAILAFSRPFTSNQDLLRRCRQDKNRLKELIRDARRARDKDAVRRYRMTKNMIGMLTLKEQGWPLVVAILPIAILGTWCFQRLAFIPPREVEKITVKAYFPLSRAGELAHIEPQLGLHEVTNPVSGEPERWIQEIMEDIDPAKGIATNAVAIWNLAGSARVEPYKLKFRYKMGSIERELLIGQPTYSPAVEFHDDNQPIMSTEIVMKPVMFLGIVPGIEWLFMPPWLIAYFLLAIPSVSLIKWMTGIC